ncbi:MAG: twin-arginine translocase TatA/TatE family subunit [Candidatus Kryptoniota bacterium]
MLEDLSIGKILLIVLVILLFFGPKKIPDIAQSLGKGIREFKKAMRDVSDEIQKPVNEEPKNQSAPPKMIQNSSPQNSRTDSSTGSQPQSGQSTTETKS